MGDESWVIAIDTGATRTTLLLEPDGADKRRAFVHAGGFVISHLEASATQSIRGALLAISGDVSVDQLCERLSTDERRVTVVRRIDGRQRVPHWPVALRRGAPERGRLWPFDAELAGIRLGTRRLVRREGLDAGEAERERAYFVQHGLAVRWLGPPHGTLVASLDPAVLDEAAAREAANVGADFRDAARWVGDALGYPPCCVDRFVQIRRREERLLLAEHLPPLRHAPAPAHTLWVNGALALISHAPCALTCAASVWLATRLLAELDRETPGFAALWLDLAHRVHALDVNGVALAIDLEGPLDGGRIRSAVQIDVGASQSRDDLVGTAVAIREHQWVGKGLTASLVADHRGNRPNPPVPDESGLASSDTPAA